tara:strand:- start:1096 stop:2286 length:1191 start_codon:yes stop_codon:yes gene_type:complete
MLEQAIVDANALREVAIKTAESNLIEKYSGQIKEAVETLLEQPLPDDEEGPLAGLDPAAIAPPGPMLDEPAEEDEIDAPLAATEGEKLCPCPDEDQVVVVNLDDLIKQAEEEGVEDEEGISPEEVEDLGEPVEGEEEMADDMEEEEELMEAHCGKDDDDEDDEDDDDEDLSESIELEEDDLIDLLETLKVDVSPDSVRSGWAGMPSAYLDEAEELELARRRDDEVSEDLEELLSAVEDLQESNEHYESMLLEAKKYIESLEKKNQEKLDQAAHTLQEVKEVAYALKNRLDEANISNARLLYTNKVLSNNSLNGRQKNQIVEALINTNSVEEAKTIYETLQSAVGSTSTSTKRQPKSLSEVVNNSSAPMLPRLNEGQQNKQDTSATNRWQILAGIKN